MSDASASPDLQRSRGIDALKERSYGSFFVVCAMITVLTTIAIFLTLLSDSLSFFSEYPIVEYLTGTSWSPGDSGGEQLFGLVPLLIGTITVTGVSAFVALPIGTLTAIYLSEYASSRARSVLKPMLEILASIPTVVYGYFALVYITPALRATIFPSLQTFNALSAALMIGIMITPMVSSISEDAMSAVPDELRQAGYGLGATKFEVSTKVVLPAAMSGIASSYILAVSRAIGETMIVVVAMGASANFPDTYTAFEGIPYIDGIPYFYPKDVLLEHGMTMTSAMVQIQGGDLAGGSIAYDAMFAIGLVLFGMTLVLNVVSDLIAERYREEY